MKKGTHMDYVKETTFHLRNKPTKNIHLGVLQVLQHSGTPTPIARQNNQVDISVGTILHLIIG